MTHQPPVIIPTKDQKQAMDWSLALASQGIEVTIVQLGEERFGLQVPGRDSSRAFQTLKLYHLENRGWGWWRSAMEGGGPRFDPQSLLWVSALVLWYGLSEQAGDIVPGGIMSSDACRQGEWWRLFTAVTLHHDLAHLAANCSIGLLLFGLAGARYGSGLSLLAAYLAGVLGNVTGLMVYDSGYNSLGASGMVMGTLGLLIARPYSDSSEPLWRRKRTLIALSAGAMLFVLLGVSGSPETDMAAHVGGFVAGLFFGWFIRRLPEQKITRLQKVAGFVFLLLLIVPWCLALRHP